MPIFKIYAITAIASAMISAVIADRQNRQLSEGTDESDSTMVSLSELSPSSWFLAVLIAWPVAYPLFLIVQFKYSAPLRMVFGILAGVFFLGLTLYAAVGLRSGEPQWEAAAKPKSIKPDGTPAPVAQYVPEPGFSPALPPPPGSTPANLATPAASVPRIPAELSVVPSAKPAAAAPAAHRAAAAPGNPSGLPGAGGAGGSRSSNVGVSILNPKGSQQ